MTADTTQNGAERKRRTRQQSKAEAAAQPFEAQLEDLEGIVTALEDGRLPLEDALSLYERGMQLAKLCQDRLDEAELRVRRLRAVAPIDGAEEEDETIFSLEDFDTDE
jgi:exodeoxyribonuclease VII small subunit